ncbi:MAG TPA: hypothetical protein VM165_19530, partial [Planctomycetaceae bacterium]|nr:hypothetical protein [Planctomycetaceae bacterium]
MSSPPHPELANSKVPLAGFVPLLVAGVLVALYVLLPFLRDEWPDMFHPLFWVFVGGLVVFSAVVFLWPKLPERMRRLIPREGIGYLLIMVV